MTFKLIYQIQTQILMYQYRQNSIIKVFLETFLLIDYAIIQLLGFSFICILNYNNRLLISELICKFQPTNNYSFAAFAASRSCLLIIARLGPLPPLYSGK